MTKLKTRTMLLSLTVAPLLGMEGWAADSAVEEPSGLEVITVTAQKVPEDLQKSAAAITAISGETLVALGVHDIRDAQNLMPSVRFQAENASTEIYIRGVGSTLDLPNIEPPTTFNFNGVYIPREGTSVGLFDIAQLELLPGPQGTLYGRAAVGGAVNVEFNRPTRVMESSGVMEAGGDSLLHGTFVQNIPVTESFALRGAFDYHHQDGYQRSGADAKDDWAGRLSALYEHGDDLDVYFWVHGARKNGDSPNLVRRGYNDGAFDGDPEAYDHDDPWDDTISAGAPTASPQDYENFVTGAQVDLKLGDVTLTYLPSYFYLDWSADYWLEDIPALLTAHYNQLTQEVRLASDGEDRLQWLAGLYAYRVDNDGDFLVGGFPLAQVSHNRLDGWALFGEATYALTDTVRVTAGGRSSWDHREGEGTTAFGQAYSADEKYDHIDWKLGLEADVGGASMLYGTIQTGYQPGTYNLFPSTPQQSNLVRSATLTAYTAGTKNRFLGDRLQINDEVFYYQYEDLLVQSFNLNTALLTTFNADKTEIYGNQLDVLFEITDSDLLNLSVGYLHAEYEEFTVPDGVNIGTPQRDFGAYPLQYAPEWTVTAGFHHDFVVGNGRLRARARRATRMRSGARSPKIAARANLTTSRPTPRSRTSRPTSAGASALWVRNIENVAVMAATTTGQFGPYGDSFIEPPRTYGARVTFRF